MKGFREFIGESKIEPILIDRLEIWPRDLGKMTWDEAKVEVAKLGPGWRLPTVDEFKEILYPNRAKIPKIRSNKFQTSAYWSSTEYENFSGWYFTFYYGKAYSNYYKPNTFYVRAVRDFTGETAITYLLKDF